MNRFCAIGSLVLAAVFFNPASSIAIYQWVDDKGVVHFSDYPNPAANREKQEQEQEAIPSPARPGKAASSQVPSPNSPAPAALPAAVKRMEAAPAPQTNSQPKPEAQAPAARTVPAQAVPVQPANSAQYVPLQSAQTASSLQPIQSVNKAPIPITPAVVLPQRKPAPGSELVAVFLTKFLLLAIAAYFYVSLCIFLIAGKLGISAAWTAWIPIIQVGPFLGAAGKPIWWVLLFFIPFVNLFVSIYLWMCIAENLGRNRLLGLLSIVPIANIIFMGMLAFSPKQGGAVSTAA